VSDAYRAVSGKYFQSFAKYAGLVAICFEWLAVLFFFILRPDIFSGQYPLSYFATLPETRLVFSVCLTIAAASAWIFARYYLYKFYVVPVRLFAISMLGFAALALVPFDPYGAVSDLLHRVFGLLFALTFLAGIYLMGKRNNHLWLRKVSYLVVVLSSFLLIVFLVTPKESQFILLFEMLGALIGQLWVVWISFHSFSKASEVN
jgi:hypothetical protein